MTDVQERVKAHIRDVLRPQVDRLVSAKVGEYIEGRVRAQLAAQVSEHVNLEELREYRRRIEEIKVKLHNAYVCSRCLCVPELTMFSMGLCLGMSSVVAVYVLIMRLALPSPIRTPSHTVIASSPPPHPIHQRGDPAQLAP
ncbi:hypothetical protein VTO73DRAFT_7192 [Trametes versicolor]